MVAKRVPRKSVCYVDKDDEVVTKRVPKKNVAPELTPTQLWVKEQWQIIQQKTTDPVLAMKRLFEASCRPPGSLPTYEEVFEDLLPTNEGCDSSWSKVENTPIEAFFAGESDTLPEDWEKELLMLHPQRHMYPYLCELEQHTNEGRDSSPGNIENTSVEAVFYGESESPSGDFEERLLDRLLEPEPTGGTESCIQGGESCHQEGECWPQGQENCHRLGLSEQTFDALDHYQKFCAAQTLSAFRMLVSTEFPKLNKLNKNKKLVKRYLPELSRATRDTLKRIGVSLTRRHGSPVKGRSDLLFLPFL